MIVTLTFNNIITNNPRDKLEIKYPVVDYCYWKRIQNFSNDDDICNILEKLLNDLNCTNEYSCGRSCMTTFPIYNTYLSDYYFYLIKIDNQVLYNKYLDKLIQRHIYNILYEYKYPYVTPAKVKKKKLPPNQFFKQVTHDLFTGEVIYVYFNPRTKEEITSSNPNMLEELNATKKKERKKTIKVKGGSVPISAMTFTFKKK